MGGFFSGETQIQTSSTVYNLAGTEKRRPDIMKAIIIRSLFSNDGKSMSERITGSLLNSTAMSLRRYYRWADSNYVYDMSKGTADTYNDLKNSDVYAALNANVSFPDGTQPALITAKIGSGDPSFWAEEWLIQNRPDIDLNEFGSTGWSVDYDRDAQQIKLQIPSEAEVLIPAPADLIWAEEDNTRDLLYIVYRTETLLDDGSYEFSSPILLTYRMGSGNVAYDALNKASVTIGDFYPAIPLRMWNIPIDDPRFASVLPNLEKAFRRLTGASVDDILKEIEDSPSVDDIDHAYIVPSVNLGTKNHLARQYLYTFMDSLISHSKSTKEGVRQHSKDVVKAYSQVWTRRGSRFYDHRNGNYDERTSHPDWGTPLQQNPPYLGNPPLSQIRIKLPHGTQFDFRIKWLYIKKTDHVGNCMRFDGVARKKAPKGRYWNWVGAPYIAKTAVNARDTVTIRDQHYNRIYMFHQYDERRYTKLEIVGLEHENWAYIVNPVVTDATLALLTPEDEEESGFLIPLHNQTFREMGLPKAAQLATETTYLVLNSYEIVKIPWYATGFFKFIIAVAAIALALPTGGGSLAAGSGILGANLAIGTALGFSAAAAAVVGAIANYLAAMIVTQLISYGAKELFGAEFGSIIGVITSFFVLGYMQGFANNGSLSLDWGQLMRVDNLMSLTNSATSAYSRFLNSETKSLGAEIDANQESYEQQLEDIQEMSDEILGMTNGVIDPMMFTDASEYFGESSEAFLNRTLLTGSDIAMLTHAMIEGFAAISLELPKPNR